MKSVLKNNLERKRWRGKPKKIWLNEIESDKIRVAGAYERELEDWFVCKTKKTIDAIYSRENWQSQRIRIVYKLQNS